MPRPHEDRQRHTLVDHRPGGPRVSFDVGAWCAIDIAAVRAERAPAAISAYETLVEQFLKSESARASSAIFRSVDHRRVVSLLEVGGHAGFRHLAAAWDDHHLYAEHRASAEDTTLKLYRVSDVAGDARIATASPDCYAVERIARPASRIAGLLAPLERAPGFRGTLVFGSEDETASVVLYRFEHEAEFVAFRESSLALAFLEPVGASGESYFAAHPVKTFGAGA